MKKYLPFLLIVAASFMLSNDSKHSYEKDAQVLNILNYKAFFNKHKNSLNFQLEAKTNEIFLETINKYRKTKRLVPLEIDTLFWLAARNHAIYQLFETKQISHFQYKKKANTFSGHNPSKRVAFVLQKKLKKNVVLPVAENCMYDGFFPENKNIQPPSELKSKEDIETLASAAAETAFQTWKKSFGHRENMLDAEMRFIGPSFIIRDEILIGVNVFSQISFRLKRPTK